MPASLLRPADLGDPYELVDQSRGMFVAGASLLGFAFFHACADFVDSGSIISALTRFAGIACAFAIVIAVQFALPRSMSKLKMSIIILGSIGCIAQFMGVNRLMQAQAEVSIFFSFHVLSQVFYTLTLITFGICVFKHRHMPNWMVFALLFAEIVWSVHYFNMINDSAPALVSMVAWGPGILAELVAFAGFIIAGRRMKVESARLIREQQALLARR